jgi:class 3 adenylate cyclase
MDQLKRVRSRVPASTGLRTAVIGTALTIFTLILSHTGILNQGEGYATDLRMRIAQNFSPPPSDEIVHVDIDVIALREIGRWPWQRERLAMAVTALKDAGAHTIALDIVLEEPQETRLERRLDGTIIEVDDDALLRRALREAGNVVLGVQETREQRTTTGAAFDLTDDVAKTGFVNVYRSGATDRGQRTVRRVPAVTATERQQFGVAAAMHFLGVQASDVRAAPDALQLGDRSKPLVNGSIIVPWRPQAPPEDAEDAAADMWLHSHAHLSMYHPVAIELHQKQLAAIVGVITEGAPLDRSPTQEQIDLALETRTLMLRDVYEGRPIDAILEDVERQSLAAVDVNEQLRLKEERDYLVALRALPEALAGVEEINEKRAWLREQVEGKLVFVGWTASGTMADFYPTALGLRTPGVTVHAAIANGILTDHWIGAVPPFIDTMTIVLAGLLATLLSTLLSPGRGWLGVLLLVGAYAAFNTFILFDAMDTLAALAAPLLAATMSWAGCTTYRAVAERAEKAMVRRQFRARVSGQLVDYIAEHPETIAFEGDERELTVIFTDFAGFTSLSERMGGRETVALLNQYMRGITDVLLDSGAYVNKFLGDGIMAFWGAPAPDPRHAEHACVSVLDGYNVLHVLNERRAELGDQSPLGMRAGISTGHVIVGDCGAPPKLNDYTVIGNAVNLAARLESANKLLGTQVLVTKRTMELIDTEKREAMLWRPIGQLRVVGQDEPATAFELLGRKGEEIDTPETARWIDDSAVAVRTFQDGDYATSMELWQKLLLQERGHAGALMYVQRCAELLQSGATDPVLPLRSK